MLDSAFHFIAAIEIYAAQDATYKWIRSNEEWELYKQVSNVLFALHLATEMFSGSTYPTANMLFSEIVSIKRALLDLSNSLNACLVNMADAMLLKFEKYWGPECTNLYSIATILDPRYKMRMIDFSFPFMFSNGELEQKLSSVKATLQELYSIYEREYKQKESSQEGSDVTCGGSGMANSSMLPLLYEFHEFIKACSAAQVPQTDLVTYLQDPNEVCYAKPFDVLLWWKFNASKYHVVSMMAKDILSIPISTVSSESDFSASGRVLDDYRSSLRPSMLEILVCTSNWIRGKHSKFGITKQRCCGGDCAIRNFFGSFSRGQQLEDCQWSLLILVR